MRRVSQSGHQAKPVSLNSLKTNNLSKWHSRGARLRAAFFRWIFDQDHVWRKLARAGTIGPRRGIRIGARLLRVFILAGVSFSVNEIPVRAAALTFTTLLASIPFAIILSSVAGALGYFDLLSRLIPFLAESFHLDLPLNSVLRALEQAQQRGFHNLGLWGSLGLLAGFYFSMSTVEAAVDKVFNLSKPRGWWGRIRVYTPFLLLLVIFVVASARILLFAREGLKSWDLTGALPAFLPRGGVLLFGALGVLAFVWLGLVLMIRILPNTRVRNLSAMVGATTATGIIYLLSRLLILFPRLLLERNLFVWGSLVVLPVALLLLYAFWAAALFGAAVAFVHQRLYRTRGEVESARLTDRDGFGEIQKEIIALWDALILLGGPENRPVTMEVLSGEMGRSEPRIQELALPLRELKWVRSKKWGASIYFRAVVSEHDVDLMQLHSLLTRLDPQGTGVLRPQSALSEILHEVKVLYSKDRGWPGFSLASVRQKGKSHE